MTKKFFLPLLVAVFLGTTMAMDLTGDWKADNGDNIYFRQVDSTVWYYGESVAENENWTSVGYGTLEDNIIKLNWTDVPKGNASLMGTVALKVASDKELEVMDQTGGWAEKGTKLMKVSSGF
jgi:hypothetical protein